MYSCSLVITRPLGWSSLKPLQQGFPLFQRQAVRPRNSLPRSGEFSSPLETKRPWLKPLKTSPPRKHVSKQIKSRPMPGNISVFGQLVSNTWICTAKCSSPYHAQKNKHHLLYQSPHRLYQPGGRHSAVSLAGCRRKRFSELVYCGTGTKHDNYRRFWYHFSHLSGSQKAFRELFLYSQRLGPCGQQPCFLCCASGAISQSGKQPVAQSHHPSFRTGNQQPIYLSDKRAHYPLQPPVVCPTPAQHTFNCRFLSLGH